MISTTPNPLNLLLNPNKKKLSFSINKRSQILKLINYFPKQIIV